MQCEEHVLDKLWNTLKTNDPAFSRQGQVRPHRRTSSQSDTSPPANNSPITCFIHKVWSEVLRQRPREHFHENGPVDGAAAMTSNSEVILWPRKMVLKSIGPKTVKTSCQPCPENHSPTQGFRYFPAGRSCTFLDLCQRLPCQMSYVSGHKVNFGEATVSYHPCVWGAKVGMRRALQRIAWFLSRLHTLDLPPMWATVDCH